MAGERAASSLAFLNFVQQRLTRTKLLMPATSYAQSLAGISRLGMERILSLVLGLSTIIGTERLVAQDYFPLTPGNKWRYEWVKSEIILEVELEPHEYNGNTYWAVLDSTPEVATDSSSLVF